MGLNLGGTILTSTSIGPKGESLKNKSNALVLHLDASNINSINASQNWWYDLSGYGNNARLINGAAYVSANGGGISFNGSNSYAEILNSASLAMTSTMSLVAWFSVPTNGLPNNRAALFSKPYYNYELGIYPGGSIHTYTRAGTGASAPAYDEGTYAYNNDGTDWIANKVYQVIWTLNGATETTYFNGVIASTGGNYTKANSGTNNTGDSLLLGSRTATGLFLNGTMYLAQVYNTTLSSTNALDLFTSQKSRFGL